jgi:hypothetical protein
MTTDSDAISVTFKWSAWTQDLDEWAYRAPSALHALETLDTGEKLTLHCISQKETRYGSVHITRTLQGGYQAEGCFSEEWDDPNDLVDTLVFVLNHLEFHDSEALVDFISDTAPRNESGDLGYTVDFKNIEADTLEQLLELVDAQEEKLIGDNEDCYFELQQSCKYWMNEHPLEIVD